MRLGRTWRGFYQWLVPGTSPAHARRVGQRLRAVLEWDVAVEYRIDNPCDRIGPAHADEQNDAVVCESGFGPRETINRVDHYYTLSIRCPPAGMNLPAPHARRVDFCVR